MSDTNLPILQNPAVLARTSQATQRVLEERANAAPHQQFLDAASFAMLQAVVDAILPQDAVGTAVDIATGIDKRLAEGTGSGWRFADLPADGEAYKQGLRALATMHFSQLTPAEREDKLRSIANGEADEAAFPLSKWLGVLKTDTVRLWLSHPSTMQAMQYYGFADGATAHTNGPTQTEGWSAITPNKSLPFEQERGA